MSEKLNNSSKTVKASNLEKPFSKAIFEKASDIARRYHVVIEFNERLGYLGSSMELPNVYVDGKTPESCYESAVEALTVVVATMLEDKQRPPIPIVDRKRSVQVNIRLTPQERSLMDYASGILGFSGLADFIRNSALERINASDALSKVMKKLAT